jgi:hypothetical protein
MPRSMPINARRRRLAIMPALVASLGGVIALPAQAGQTLRDLVSVQMVRNVSFGAQLKSALEVGVRSVRVGLRWNEIEKDPGSFDWRGADDKMRPILGSKIRPIVTFFGSNGAYPATDGGGVGNSDEARNGFARFAAEAVKRYGIGSAERPILYEIWNEPNTKTFWGKIPDPEAYAALAVASCKAIKTANPDAKVLGLVTEGTPVKKPYLPKGYGLDIYREWSQRALTDELAACVDGISMHPYRDVPETYLDEEKALQTYLQAKWKKPGPPLVVNSEWGYGLYDKADNPEAHQAALTVRLVLLGTGAGRVTNIYQVMDGGRDVTKHDNTYGLFLFQGRAKPAGEAVKRLMQAIGDFTIDGVETLEPGSGLYRFRAHGEGADASGQAVVLWSNDGAQEVDFPSELRGKTVELVDLVSGAPVERADKLQVSESPLLILAK